MTHQHLIPLCTASRACFASMGTPEVLAAAAVHTALCLSDLGYWEHSRCCLTCQTAGLDTYINSGGRFAGCLLVLPYNSHGYRNLREWQSPECDAKANVLLCCGAPIFIREQEEYRDILWTKSSRILISLDTEGKYISPEHFPRHTG